MNRLTLRKNEDHRLTAGHLWIFSNEIASIDGSPETGEVVELARYDGKFLGCGFYHPHSLIAFRLLTRDKEEISPDFFKKRLQQASKLRSTLYPESHCYRLVYGESDFLPGLIVDRYNEFLSIQTLSAGMDKRLPDICDALEELFLPHGIIERNDAGVRTLEQLPQRTGVLRGSAGTTTYDEDGIGFHIDPLNGQKTGFFLDQRENRLRVRRYVRGADVLDCFCNEGGFGLNAARGGAASVIGVDVSQAVIERARQNTDVNGLTNVQFETADVFDALKAYVHEGRQFDVVILDPPSFTKSKRTVATALKGYREINSLALQLIRPGGFLITASCSHHVTEEAFLEMVLRSSHKAQRNIQLLEFVGASADHPVHPAMPETKYLKFAVYSVL